MLNAIAGHDSKDPTSLRVSVPDYVAESMKGIQGVRIGLPYGYATGGVDPEVVSAWENAAAAIRSLGAITNPITHPEWEKAVATWPALCSAETAWAHRDASPIAKGQIRPSPVWLHRAGPIAFGGRTGRCQNRTTVAIIGIPPTEN